MMDAEEDIDFLPDELLAMSMNSDGSSKTPSLGSTDENFGRKNVAGATKINRNEDDSIKTSDFMIKSEHSSGSGTHTPVELEAPVQSKKPPVLFDQDSTKDLFSSSKPAVPSAGSLFSSGSANEDFLGVAKNASSISSFDLINKNGSVQGSLSNPSSLMSSTAPFGSVQESLSNPPSLMSSTAPFSGVEVFQSRELDQPKAYVSTTMNSNSSLNSGNYSQPPEHTRASADNFNMNNQTNSFLSQSHTPFVPTAHATKNAGPVPVPNSHSQSNMLITNNPYMSPYTPAISSANSIQSNLNNSSPTSGIPAINPNASVASNTIPTGSIIPPSNMPTVNLGATIPSSSMHNVNNASNVPMMHNTSSTSMHNAYHASNAPMMHNTSTTPQSTTGTPGLFIPNMYNDQIDKTDGNSSNFFVPSQPTDSSYTYREAANPPIPDPSSMQQANNVQHFSPNYQQPLDGYYNQSPPQNQDGSMYQVQTGIDEHGRGIWQWIKKTMNKDWSAQQWKQQIKNATDSVLTTLDPQMEQYLKPVTNVGVASQNTAIVLGVKQGFSDHTGVAVIRGHPYSNNSIPVLPIGFETAVKATNDALDQLSTVNFGFTTEYILTAVQVFITELIPNQWSAMFCVGLKDIRRNLYLHSFSQSIPLPLDVVTIAYNNSQQKENWFGYDLSIDEAVRRHIPYSNEQDWSLVLTGIPVRKIIEMTSQALSRDYRRQVASMPVDNQQYDVNNFNNGTSYNQGHQNYHQQQNIQGGQYQPALQYPQGQQYQQQPPEQQKNNQQSSVVFNGFG